jgi:L-lactate dehydrogenase complex protein LldF
MTGFATKFLKDAQRMTRDLRHRLLIRTALRNYEVVRDQRRTAFQNWQAARQAAAETKWEAINHLDRHLIEFADKLAARGTKVHWASTGAQAREIILGIVRGKKRVRSSSPRP